MVLKELLCDLLYNYSVILNNLSRTDSPAARLVRPIYEVMSSHSARRAFYGNMYDKVQDPNLICALTGHKEGSKSFARYRNINEDTNRKTISLLE